MSSEVRDSNSSMCEARNGGRESDPGKDTRPGPAFFKATKAGCYLVADMRRLRSDTRDGVTIEHRGRISVVEEGRR